VSKKSLDDYLLQLRFGKKFGFDFQKHKDDKVGVLRSYVKTEKNKQKSFTSSSKQGKGAPTKGKRTKRGDSSDEEDKDDDDEDDDDMDDM
jgi:hypothetical protein